MGLADALRCTSVVYEKRGAILLRMCMKMHFFLFRGFCGTPTVSFGQVTREHLRCYGQYLYERGLKLNTVSTYMRMLRSIYNRGVESGKAPYVHRLFHGVYTGVDVRQKEGFAGN